MRQHHHCCHGLHRRFAKTFTSLALLLVVFASLPQPASASQILSYQISQSSDDCVRYSTGFNLIYEYVRLQSTTYTDNGLRFENITLDQNQPLYYAKLIFTGYATSGALTSRIYGEDSADPVTYVDAADFDARSRTSDLVVWIVPAFTNNVEYEIDITSIVNILLANASWVNGNSMAFFWTRTSGTGNRQAYSYDNTPAKAVQLEIKYKETFYITFYENNDNAYYIENYGWGGELTNGSEFGVPEEEIIILITALNGSYVFQNYTVIGDSAYFTNPLTWTMPENFGNTTIWTYTALVPTTIEENLEQYFLLGATLTFFIVLVIKSKRQP